MHKLHVLNLNPKLNELKAYSNESEQLSWVADNGSEGGKKSGHSSLASGSRPKLYRSSSAASLSTPLFTQALVHMPASWIDMLKRDTIYFMILDEIIFLDHGSTTGSLQIFVYSGG